MGSALAKQLRSPDPGSCYGWMAQKIMSMGKGEDSIDAVSQMKLDGGALLSAENKPVLVELGPGAGYSLREMISSFQPSRVYAIEISEAFRNILTTDNDLKPSIASGVLSVHGDDAKDLKEFIPDNSVDAIFAFNVIYFLDPLEDYLKEMMRILKPGGKVYFGVKDVAKNMDQSIYINTDWDVCLDQMKAIGLEDVSQGEARLEGPVSYTPLVGTKPTSK